MKSDGFSFVKVNSAYHMQAAVLKGPISVSIEADTTYFYSYQSGILNDTVACGTNLDHAVVIVGYSSHDVP